MSFPILMTEQDMHNAKQVLIDLTNKGNKMTNNNPEAVAEFSPVDTTELQEESLTNFMASLGWEPVYDYERGLIRFTQPAFRRFGEENISVNTAIKMHNTYAEGTFALFNLRADPNMSFKDFLSNPSNVYAIEALFAGTTKIVETVNATFSKKKGFVVHKHLVRFMTPKDEKHYSFWFEKANEAQV